MQKYRIHNKVIIFGFGAWELITGGGGGGGGGGAFMARAYTVMVI